MDSACVDRAINAEHAVSAGSEHVHMLLETIERLTDHLELDGELVHIQQAKSSVLDEINQLQTQKGVSAMEEVSVNCWLSVNRPMHTPRQEHR